MADNYPQSKQSLCDLASFARATGGNPQNMNHPNNAFREGVRQDPKSLPDALVTYKEDIRIYLGMPPNTYLTLSDADRAFAEGYLCYTLNSNGALLTSTQLLDALGKVGAPEGMY